MTISEKKIQIVINNYFESECDVNTSIHQAFEKGFRIGIKKGLSAQPERPKGEWTATYSDCGGDVWVSWKCSNCGYVRKKGWEYTNDGKRPDALFCEICNADMRGEKE